MPRKLLTIVIPTYNRSEYLALTLASIISQIKSGGLQERISIHVNDNASTDKSEETVCNITKDSGCDITYAKNKSNLGFDRNCDLAVRCAKTEWAWFFGDDDLLEPGALKYISDSLLGLGKDVNFASVLVNLYSSDMKKLLVDTSREYACDMVVRGVSKTSAHFYNKHGFMGSIIFRAGKWAQTQNLEKYLGSQIVHVYFMLYWVSKNEKIAFFNRVCIRQRSGHTTRPKGEMFSIIRGCLRDRAQMVMDLFPEKNDQHMLLGSYFSFQKFPLLLFKQYESNWVLISKEDISLFRDSFGAYGFMPAFWIYCIPQFLCPPLIAKIIARAYSASKTALASSQQTPTLCL